LKTRWDRRIAVQDLIAPNIENIAALHRGHYREHVPVRQCANEAAPRRDCWDVQEITIERVTSIRERVSPI
jgi:hypothetical protein